LPIGKTGIVGELRLVQTLGKYSPQLAILQNLDVGIFKLPVRVGHVEAAVRQVMSLQCFHAASDPAATDTLSVRRQRHSILHVILLLTVLFSSLQPCTTDADTCDVRPLMPFQAINGTAEGCATCLFPTYPYINSVDVSAFPLMDLTDA